MMKVGIWGNAGSDSLFLLGVSFVNIPVLVALLIRVFRPLVFRQTMTKSLQ